MATITFRVARIPYCNTRSGVSSGTNPQNNIWGDREGSPLIFRNKELYLTNNTDGILTDNMNECFVMHNNLYNIANPDNRFLYRMRIADGTWQTASEPDASDIKDYNFGVFANDTSTTPDSRYLKLYLTAEAGVRRSVSLYDSDWQTNADIDDKDAFVDNITTEIAEAISNSRALPAQYLEPLALHDNWVLYIFFHQLDSVISQTYTVPLFYPGDDSDLSEVVEVII